MMTAQWARAIRVIAEEKPRGTTGALLSIRQIARQRFLLLNGVSFFDTNLRALTTQALKVDGDAFLALRLVDDGSAYGTVQLDGNRITSFHEKDDIKPDPRFINAGIYVFSSKVIDRILAKYI